jgi:hypothetical protein
MGPPAARWTSWHVLMEDMKVRRSNLIFQMPDCSSPDSGYTSLHRGYGEINRLLEDRRCGQTGRFLRRRLVKCRHNPQARTMQYM